MNNIFSRKGALVGGISSLFLGIILLLWTNPIVGWLSHWWPLILMVLGGFFWYKVVVRKGRPRFIFSGTVLFLTGLQLQLISLGLITLESSWPGFATSIGLAFIPYALVFKKRQLKVTLLIPAITLLILSLIFFVFSLKLMPVGYSFQNFATQWWPLVFILFGISLLFSYYYRTPNKEE
ncbi:MAG: hypothetical protein A2Z96_02200 [Spirochaetes bacterium GWB1_48_6]|nr:MAG: hypothetical protein A2Z96_02200 [Spirochaetes bacterium GWB1_48_6]